MATGFSRKRHGITAVLEPGEVRLLDSLLADVAEMLQDPTTSAGDPVATELGVADLDIGVGEPPADPAVARLLPPASRDDAAAADFRRFTERGLRRRKLDGLRTARRTLAGREADEVEQVGLRLRLRDEEARAWVVALTDLRLVLADRLGVRTDADAEALHAHVADPDSPDPAAWLAAVYDFVSWMQESLTDVLLKDLPTGGDGRRPVPPGLDDPPI